MRAGRVQIVRRIADNWNDVVAILFSGRGDEPGTEYFEAPDVLIASRARQFEIGDRINAGGNGVVHACVDVVTGNQYAVKFQLDQRPERLERFAREQQLLADLEHDHLITYEDHGTTKGDRVVKRRRGQVSRNSTKIPYVIMELARCSLFDIVRTEDITPEVYFAQFRGLSRALGVLHGKAIHRDIKPENILVVGERWALSDYGLCDLHDTSHAQRLTPDWQVVGPRFWMSPEANNRSIGRTEPINSASDVFQLASVFWFVVNRSHPTGILSRSDWAGPEALFEPIFKALHYDCKVRPQDGNTFALLIENAILNPT
jgi:eukaryotic-like serine/threonine-protein kinase